MVRIAEELAADAGVAFAGAVLRPHASRMRRGGELTPEGKAVLDSVRRAGHELVRDGTMSEGILEEISRPLVSREDFWSTR